MYYNIINWNALQREWERMRIERSANRQRLDYLFRRVDRIEKELEALKQERCERKDEKEGKK